MKNNFQFYRGTVDKSTTANSMSSIKEQVAKEHAPKFECVYAKRTQKDMSDDEIEGNAFDKLSSDKAFFNEMLNAFTGGKR